MSSMFKDFTSEPLASADVDDYLMKQANIAITAGSEPTGVEGMEVHITDRDQVRIYSGSAFVRTGWWSAGGRTGVQLRRNSNQAISNASSTAIGWDTEDIDSDAFYTPSGGTITIPSGCGGVYGAQVQTNWSAAVGSLAGKILFVRNGSNLYEHTIHDAASGEAASFFPVALSVGDTVAINVIQTSGGSLNLTGRLEFYRLGA